MIVTLTLVRDAIMEQWHKQEIQDVKNALLVYFNLKMGKERVSRVSRVPGVIQ